MAPLQIRAPWDDHLWSLLSSAPQKTSKQFIQIINDNLVQRRRHRVRLSERSGSLMRKLGTWSGSYVDIPMSIASVESKVHYNIAFNADGTVEGFGSSAEGNFTINGTYNLRKGTVAWRQVAASCPVWWNPCVKYGAKIEAEFFGHMLNVAGPGPAQIAGTFLTDLGRYCAVNLTTSESETGTSMPRFCGNGFCESQVCAQTEQLPTLLCSRLTGKWQPLKKEDEERARKRKEFVKQWTNNSDTKHAWYDEDEEEDESEQNSTEGV